jgi:outer membrane receptor protein involved in Fe transport
MLKYNRRLGSDSSLELTGSRRDELFSLNSRQYQYDGEAIHRFGWIEGRMNTAWGAGYRHMMANDPVLYSPGTPRQGVDVRRAFLQQSWEPWDKLILSGAFSLENSNLAQTEAAYQAAAVAPLSPHHALRASYAMSPTLPALFEERADATLPGISFTGNKGIDAAHVSSFEISHLGTFRERRIDTEATLFYMRYRDIPRTMTLSQTLVPFSVNLGFHNADDAIARGAEFKARYRFQPNRYVYANYTFEHITDETGDLDVTDGTPPHKANAGAFVHLWRGLSASADVGYKTGYRISSLLTGAFHVPAYARVDARLAYKAGPCEVFVAGQNLARPRHQEFTTALLVPRTFYGGASVKF